jgi:signal transduction histidine kinase
MTGEAQATTEGGAVTVDVMSAEQVGERHALTCPPDVAKWLHDKVVQRLSGVVAALGTHGVLREADRARCSAELEVALAALRLLLNDQVGQPPDRRLRTVVEAVRSAAAATPAGRAAYLRILGDAEISPATGELVADFVAEAMRNVAKHAVAQEIVLTVAVDERAVRVDAFNDGVTPAAGGPGAGVGLRLLAARALDHCGAVAGRAESPDGWSATLTLARGACEPDGRPGPSTAPDAS